ncbi:MAG: hypothetical protein JNM59_04490 [Hyphomonadaceae bacterium]|nr:hypothetical protein [Hyphomonadaceae bacterium]
MGNIVSWLSGELAVRGAEEAIRRFYDRKKADASEELSEALRNANISMDEAVASDETIAMLHRWDRAWKEGAAREKLRLLAQLLAGELGPEARGSDEFLNLADIVVSLSHEEIVFLAVLAKYEAFAATQSKEAYQAHKIVRRLTTEALVGKGKAFANTDEFIAAGVALGRTGFVQPVDGGTGKSFAKTARLDRLVRLTRLEEWAERAV